MSKNNTTADKILEYMNSYKKSYGYIPSIREMCQAFDMSATSSIFYYLKILEKQGKIKRTGLKSRAIEIIDEGSTQANKVPVIGTVAAGSPILATENIEDYIEIPKGYFSSDDSTLFVLKVKGDSMINAGIFEGDEIIVKKQNTAENGQLVVALIDDSATVKRFFKEKDHIRLMPENQNYSPIITNTATILGIVQGLLRRYK